jgi:CBS domain-containing protein
MKIADVCRREVQVAQPAETVLVAAARMRQRNVGSLLVLDPERRPLGILTDRDLALRVLGEGRDPASTKVADVMTRHPQALSLETPVEDGLVAMRQFGVRRMPVVGARGEVVGMVSIDDFLTPLAATLEDLSRVVGHSAAGCSPPALVPAGKPAMRARETAGLERMSSDPQC